MDILWILLTVAAVLLAVVLIAAYVCFRMAFYAPRKKSAVTEEFDIPSGTVFKPYRERMMGWVRETRGMPREEMTITSFDGLTLRGNYYEFSPGAPIELMFHGYRSTAEHDLCGGVQRCFKLGHSALIVDQRCSGSSGGNVITFGIHESRDCLSWVEYAIRRFGPDVKLILTGISMGAATVLMAGGEALPDNVVGILADCGYTSPKEIICQVIRQMKLPPKLAYPFVRLGAKLYGHFDLESNSPLEAMARCRVPVILFHGEDDDFVPCQMSVRNYDACTSRKKLVTVPGAGHGMSCLVARGEYYAALREFFADI